MALRTFGQDWTYDFYALTPNGHSHEALPSAPDSVYLYDGRPTEDDASAGTTNDGSYTVVQGPIAAWTDTPDSRGKRVSFTAVDEPSDFTGLERKYYVVVNLTLDGAALAPVIREVRFQRLRSQESVIDVTVSDILGMEPMIGVEFPASVTELPLYIDAAVEEIRFTLDGCSRGYADYLDPGKLKIPAIQLAISKFFFGQSRSVNDIHYSNGLRFRDLYSQSSKRIGLEFDSDRDGSPEGVIKSPSGVKTLRIMR